MSYPYRYSGQGQQRAMPQLLTGNFPGVFIGAHDGGYQRNTKNEITPTVVLHFQIETEDEQRLDVYRFMDATDIPGDPLPRLIKVLSNRDLPKRFEMDLDKLSGRCCEVVIRKAKSSAGKEFTFLGDFKPFPAGRDPIRPIDADEELPSWVQKRIDESLQKPDDADKTKNNDDDDELFRLA